MQVRRLFTALVAAAICSGTGGLALAQQSPSKPGPQTGGDQRSMDHEGTMGGGGMMGGMGGMMGGMGGRGMMGGGMNHHGMMSRMIMVPQMPPGNEKLQFQMHAEMMQKVGEIAAKYAGQIKEQTRAAPR